MLGFHTVPLLYECQANPFLSERGTVDLSGGRSDDPLKAVPMSEQSPITFSLPSKMHGDNDAHGLCTVQLLAALQRRWERVLDRVQRDARFETRAADEPQQRQAVLTFRTPAPLLAEYLLEYQRERDLLPVVLQSAYFAAADDQPAPSPVAVPSMLWSEPQLLYDFALVQEHLERRLLRNKRPVAVQVAQYVYRGDVKRSGALIMLRVVCAQRQLPAVLHAAVEQQLDTQERALALFTVLQSVIEFLVSAHAGRAALLGDHQRASLGDTLLAEYACDTLLIPAAQWCLATCPAVDREARLCHVQLLFLLLEQNLAGGTSPLARVALRYRAELSAELREHLRTALPLLDCSHVAAVLRDLMLEQLCEARWPGDAGLHEFLEFADPDLGELSWFVEHFPGELRLGHSFNVYTLLQRQE
jgi:hypothetical protein